MRFKYEINRNLKAIRAVTLMVVTLVALTGCFAAMRPFITWDTKKYDDLLMNGKFHEATQALERDLSGLTEKDNAYWTRVSYLTRIYASLGKYQDVVKWCRPYKDSAGRSPLKTNRRTHVELFGRLLEAYYQLYDFDNAKLTADYITAFIDRAPWIERRDYLTIYPALFNVYFNTGCGDMAQKIVLEIEQTMAARYTVGKDGKISAVDFNHSYFTQHTIEGLKSLARFYYFKKDYAKARQIMTYYCEHKTSYTQTLSVIAFLALGMVSGTDEMTGGFIREDLFIANCLVKENQIDQAMKTVRRANDKIEGQLGETIPIAGAYWEAQKILGDCYRLKGRTDHAIDHYRKAIEEVEKTRAQLEMSRSRILYAESKNELYAYLIQLLASQKQFQLAFAYAERSRSRAFLDMFASKNLEPQEEKARIMVTKHDALVREIQEMTVQAILGQSRGKTGHLSRGINDKRNQLETLVRDFSEQYPDLATTVSVNPVELTEIMESLEPGTILLSYYSTAEKTIAWVISRTRFQGVALSMSRDEVNQMVKICRQAITANKSKEFLTSASQLYLKLIAPLEGDIHGAKRLCIIRHGSLHHLPFQVLYDGNHYLGETQSVFYVPSSSVYLLSRAKNRPKKLSILALGNPDLDDASLVLPSAEKEVLEIKARFKDAKVFTGPQASKQAFQRNKEEHAILHIASHAIFDDVNPMQSGLCLSGPGLKGGMLTSSEIYDMRLQAYLVTLSGCETAVGKTTSGDEVISLSRAFLLAGASSVVSSLWQVDDASTAFYMTEFYSALQRTDKDQALKIALQRTKQRYTDPYHWGAFVLTGDWR